jgi:PPOX class probable F420-dependent enzyme
MSETEVRAFLMSDPPHTGKLATTRKDGSPHVTPVWYVLDDDGDILFNTGAESLKGRTLRRDPRCAMCVDDERPPFSFVLVEAIVEISNEHEAKLLWATRIGGRYMGAENAEAFGVRNAVPSELLVRLRPTRIIAQADIAD